MTITVEPLTGDALTQALPDLAQLRMTVFRAFPYLYDGDMEYEERYLASYRDNPRAVLVAARDGDRIVGASTGMPLVDHADAASLAHPDLPPAETIYYCAESVLLADYRGRGIGHLFFDIREAEARRMGFEYALFCGVVRPDDHPERPVDHRPLEGVWAKRGYQKLPGVTATFHWTDIGSDMETPHSLQAWMRRL
ncbi:GNAT family N-acetyltransferase [Shimia ponticola]|uniref:GNAT family N-acetyltransferase n=1 Tax=Shimia ponticola TaxID=2582893 RepID=UPI003D273FB9